MTTRKCAVGKHIDLDHKTLLKQLLRCEGTKKMQTAERLLKKTGCAHLGFSLFFFNFYKFIRNNIFIFHFYFARD